MLGSGLSRRAARWAAANLHRRSGVGSGMRWPRVGTAPGLAVLLAVAAVAWTTGRPTTPPTVSTQARPQVPARLAGLLAGTAVLFGIGVSTDPHADPAVAAASASPPPRPAGGWRAPRSAAGPPWR
jgi:hypothetical protein